MSLPGTASVTKYLDMLVTPELRQRILAQLLGFVLDKPYHASFLATFLFFAFVPLLGLIVFLVSLAVVLVATAVFWIGVALLITASFLAVAALLATGTYLYLVGIFLAGRWVRRTFFPASDAKVQEVKQRVQQRLQVPTIKEEVLNDEGSDSGATTPIDKKEPGAPEDEERDKMRRDIAKSLK